MWKVTRYLDALSQNAHRLGPAGRNPPRIPAVHGDCWTGPRRSGCCKPRYRRLRDIKRPRYVGLRFATSKALEGFLPLVWCESSGTAETHATVLSALPALACTSFDEFTLELGSGDVIE